MKGDATKVQNQIDYRGGQSQDRLNNLRDSQVPQNQDLTNRFNVSADRSRNDLSNIMSGYGDYMNQANNPLSFGAMPGYAEFGRGGRDMGFDPMGLSAVGDSMSGYRDFASTGGYREGDIESMRARAQGSIRSAYDTAQRNIDRERRLRGGNSPNYTAATAKLTRDMGQGLSDANISLEAQLADSIRQGKMFGTQGLGNLGLGQEGMGINLGSANNSARLAGLSGQAGIDATRLQSILSGLSGQTSAYSATPGETSMYGSLLGQSNANLTNIEQLQAQIAQLMIQSQLARSQVPSNFNQALGNIGGVLGAGGKFLGGLPGLFGSSSSGVSGIPGRTPGPF